MGKPQGVFLVSSGLLVLCVSEHCYALQSIGDGIGEVFFLGMFCQVKLKNRKVRQGARWRTTMSLSGGVPRLPTSSCARAHTFDQAFPRFALWAVPRSAYVKTRAAKRIIVPTYVYVGR